MNVVILAFNFGYAGKVVNGPGMCLANFVKFFLEIYPDAKIKVFTQLQSPSGIWPDIHGVNETRELSKAIKYADIVHHWSGITSDLIWAVRFANNLEKKVIAGPNLIDTVELIKENDYLKKIKFDMLLTVNEHLRFRIHKFHQIPLEKMDIFLVGPDPELWYPSKINDGTILWKGNSKQFVKNVWFAKEIEEKLGNKYKFKFIGYPNPYDYSDHIENAKNSKLLIVTSLSETMGLAMAEAWQSGVPSISHPKIYLHGENYRTGIITNYDINSYIQAIDEVMGDDILYKYMSDSAIEYMNKNLSSSMIVNNYMRIINGQKTFHID